MCGPNGGVACALSSPALGGHLLDSAAVALPDLVTGPVFKTGGGR